MHLEKRGETNWCMLIMQSTIAPLTLVSRECPSLRKSDMQMYKVD